MARREVLPEPSLQAILVACGADVDDVRLSTDTPDGGCFADDVNAYIGGNCSQEIRFCLAVELTPVSKTLRLEITGQHERTIVVAGMLEDKQAVSEMCVDRTFLAFEGAASPRASAIVASARLESCLRQNHLLGGPAGPISPAIQRFWKFGTDMTAIAIIVSDEGLAIAADGLCTAEDGEIEGESEQKIFQARCMGRDVAYAMVGMLLNEARTYNLVSGIDAAMKAAARRRFGSFGKYIDTIGSAARLTISEALQQRVIDPGLPKDEFAGVYIASYFNGCTPTLGIIVLSSSGGCSTQIYTPPKGHRFLGSDIIVDLINTGEDERLMKYFHPHEHYHSLAEATNLARAYIEACCDPVAREIDPGCRLIGGHIHVATLTQTDGFRWVARPLGYQFP